MKQLLIIVGLVVALTGCAQAYDIYIVDPPINKYQLLADEPLPATYQIGDTLDLMAAPGEYEPASFVVETNKPLVDVRVHCTLLQSEDAALPRDAVDVRLVEWWSIGTHGIGNVATPWILVHDPEMITVLEEMSPYYANLTEEDYVLDTEGGIIPDWGNYPETLEEFKALHATKNRVLKELIDAHTLRPVDIPKREQFWVTVHIPDDAVPGTYTGTLRIVPANAPAQKLKLKVWVPDIKLLPPREEYSIYYPTYLLEPAQGFRDARDLHVPDEQMLLEYKNMVEHGCLNPNVYEGPILDASGSLNFDLLERHTELRRLAGMRIEGTGLYIVATGQFASDDIGQVMRSGDLTPEEYARSAEVTRQIVKWARDTGYGDVYFMGVDEVAGEVLRGERECWQAILDGGGKIFVACWPDFGELVGDLLDVAVIQPPDSIRADRQQHTALAKNVLLAPDEHVHWRPESLLVPEWQDIIRGVHERGKRIFMYMDPWGGWPLADDHRRVRGFGMWLSGMDGTMNMGYSGVRSDAGAPSPDDASMLANGVNTSLKMVVRARRGVLDTLAWEAYREAYDDSRYVATLLAAGGEDWLNAQPQERITKGNLDELRRDVAREILRLQNK